MAGMLQMKCTLGGIRKLVWLPPFFTSLDLQPPLAVTALHILKQYSIT
jgi:hypothetical protein